MTCPVCKREQCWGGNVCETFNSSIVKSLPTQTKNLYKNLYVFLTEEQINEEIKFFEETLEDSQRISLTGSNSQKYLRGWLLRANEEAKREKKHADRVRAMKVISDNSVYGKGF